jgi:hypothetical protein
MQHFTEEVYLFGSMIYSSFWGNGIEHTLSLSHTHTHTQIYSVFQDEKIMVYYWSLCQNILINLSCNTSAEIEHNYNLVW